MELTAEHLERIKESLPVERGNVSIDSLCFLNAVLADWSTTASSQCQSDKLRLHNINVRHTSTRMPLNNSAQLASAQQAKFAFQSNINGG